METPRLFRVPVGESSEVDRARAEISAAIELVALGSARRVVLACIAAVDAVAGEGRDQARTAGVQFSTQRDSVTGAVSVVIGPLEV